MPPVGPDEPSPSQNPVYAWLQLQLRLYEPPWPHYLQPTAVLSLHPQISIKHPSEREREQLAANKTGGQTFYLPSGVFPVPPVCLHPELRRPGMSHIMTSYIESMKIKQNKFLYLTKNAASFDNHISITAPQKGCSQ